MGGVQGLGFKRGSWGALLGVGALVVTACAAGTGDNGFGSAASLGGGDNAEGTADGGSADWVGTIDDDGGSAEGLGTFGAQTGSQDESGSDGNGDDNADGPVNPNESCNGIDDDGNGLVDDGLGMLNCGMGVCAASVAACDNGVPGNCVPLAGSPESCNGLDDDCNGQVDENITSTCSSACGSGTETCVGGVPECDAPQPQAETCNYDDDNCDGSLDEGVAGCRIGVHRSYNSSSGEHFYTTNLAEAQSAGFTLEAQNYYDVYAASHPGLVAFYRCLKANGFHFYTTSATCEGQTVEGVMGYVSSSDADETTALFRLFSNGDHFYTTSAAERDSAVASGYVYEGVACYVF